MRCQSFFDMPLSMGMKTTLDHLGFKEPTPIQKDSIFPLLNGLDVLGQAQTGTGKTAAFAIPLLEKLDDEKKSVQALVICPTRELCVQVCKEIDRLSTHKASSSVLALYGGQAIEHQIRSLKYDLPKIIVATPGRLFDHLRRRSLDLSDVTMVVLDEADEMLDMGFKPEIDQMFALLPRENQRIFFSATMSKAIEDLAFTYLKNACIIKMAAKAVTANNIVQSYLRVRSKDKFELLCRLIDLCNPKLAVVFSNTKAAADELVEGLKDRGFDAGALHGDLSQGQRDRMMAKFRAGKLKVLVATDVAARGIDVEDVGLVINYHLPHDPEDYVHRVGRTGRAGRKGRAISLVEPRDNSRLQKISQFARIQIKEEQPPTISAVRSAKLSNLFQEISDFLKSGKTSEYKSFIKSQNLLSAEDIATGMIGLAFSNLDNGSDAFFENTPNPKERSAKRSRFSAGNRVADKRHSRPRNSRSEVEQARGQEDKRENRKVRHLSTRDKRIRKKG